MIDWHGRRVLVTGGAGFIGSHLVDRLVELGASVRVLDDMSTGREENIHHHRRGSLVVAEQRRAIEVMDYKDIRDFAACREACAGVDTVFHQAALAHVPNSLTRPAECIDVNVLGTANVFEAARDAKVRRVVYASSSAVYGDWSMRPDNAPHTAYIPVDESIEGIALSPYALSKQMNEQLAEVFAYCYELEAIGLRYFNVYGPRQRADTGAVVPCFLRRAAAGEQPIINGSGDQTRDFVHVSDVVEANLLAASSHVGACNEAYNVGTGRATSLNALSELVCKHDNIYAPARPDEVQHSVADLTRISNALGYSPKVALEDGIGHMMARLR